jgi:hypothetical protein
MIIKIMVLENLIEIISKITNLKIKERAISELK